jgi:hypothetical protein
VRAIFKEAMELASGEANMRQDPSRDAIEDAREES